MEPGMSSGVKRALESQPGIRFVNDTDGERFIVIIPRRKRLDQASLTRLCVKKLQAMQIRSLLQLLKGITLVSAALLLLLQGLPVLAQQKTGGTVIDAVTSEPVNLVHVINKGTGELSITGYQGEFEIIAAPGDLLAFVKDGYISRTMIIPDQAGPLRISLSKKPDPPSSSSELLPQVTVYGQSYLADSLQLRREYERYFPSPPPTLEDAIGSNGGLDLNAFISRMMTPWDREFSERLLEYEQKKYIDKVFTVARVKQVVDIRDEELEEFMRTCRPSYAFLVTATEYDLVKYIRDAYRLYRSAKYGETLRRGNTP